MEPLVQSVRGRATNPLDRLSWPLALLIVIGGSAGAAVCFLAVSGMVWNSDLAVLVGLVGVLAATAAFLAALNLAGRLLTPAIDAVPEKIWHLLGKILVYAILVALVVGVLALVVGGGVLALSLIDKKLLWIAAIAILAYYVIRVAVAAGIRDAQVRNTHHERDDYDD